MGSGIGPAIDLDRRLLRDLMLGRATLDRAAHLRTEPQRLDELWAHASTRVLLLDGGRLPVTDGEAPQLVLLAPADVDGDIAQTERHLLGTNTNGGAVFLARPTLAGTSDDDRDHPRPAPLGAIWVGLREVGANLDDHDAGIAVTAVALDSWHRSHPHCARCGQATEIASGGWVRRCPDDGSEHYPRTDPAVIMLVRDEYDRALLGHQAAWPEGWFSTLAGFVEPGETAEAAVRREVLEESGIHLGADPDDVVYLGSQPWPFPSSLMLGYHARAASHDIAVDGVEIGEARWFSREQLRDECAAGTLRVPSSISIARRLIERWYGEPLPESWSRP